jgi:biotin transporter BioY
MKTLIAFIAGLITGVGVGALSIAVYLTAGDDTNHNGYERADR